jgi:xanthosine phosphorylase
MYPDIRQSVEMAVAAIQSKLRMVVHPRLALIAGSGLGGVAELLDNPRTLSYSEIPGFPEPGVHGHKGQLMIGSVGGLEVVLLLGRIHVYEGPESWRLKVMIRTMKALGCEFLFLTNAAGSMRQEIGPGDLVMITDHINFMGTNPLVGPNEDHFGPRFVDLEDCWDPQLRQWLLEAAEAVDTPLHQGVFAGWMGPAFETPAEIRMLSRLGADTVGMSTVPDNLIARHCGLRVVGVSVITNMACGMSAQKVSHELTLAQAERGAARLIPVIQRFLMRLAEG